MSSIKTPSEGIDEWLEEEEKLNKIVQIIDKNIVINASYEYDIPLAECATHERILHWVWHLADKPWMTQSITKKFIQVACNHHSLKLH